MKRFILKRILFVIPTLFLVLILAFFLSKMVPGDLAESMINLQGVQHYAKNELQEYKNQYKRLHLDSPLFYFSILPDFYPDNVNAIISPTERQQTKAFLAQKIAYQPINDYLKLRKIYLSQMTTWCETKDSITKINIENTLSKLKFTTDINEIQKLWTTIFQLQIKELNFHPIQVAINELSLNKIRWYLPTFRWHGSQNQFHIWLSSLTQGKLGASIIDGRQVSLKIFNAFKWTLLLSLINIMVSSIIAVPSGMWAGYWPESSFDRIFSNIWLALYSIPVFWLASALIVYCTSARFGTWLDIFPTPGSWYLSEDNGMWATISQYSKQLILPIICLVANDIAQLSRIVRNNVMAQKSSQYVLVAKAKGVSDIGILTKHIFPNIMIPLITVIGGKLPAGLSGALIIEVIFNIPGMGRLMYESIFNADWNVVFGILIMVSLVSIITMIITDILYALANPKIKSSII